MYAGVPCYNLKKLTRAIATDMLPPRTLPGAWREMRATWRRQQSEPDYQYDTPVPSPREGSSVLASEEEAALESSIGDLAPAALRGAG